MGRYIALYIRACICVCDLPVRAYMYMDLCITSVFPFVVRLCSCWFPLHARPKLNLFQFDAKLTTSHSTRNPPPSPHALQNLRTPHEILSKTPAAPAHAFVTPRIVYFSYTTHKHLLILMELTQAHRTNRKKACETLNPTS